MIILPRARTKYGRKNFPYKKFFLWKWIPVAFLTNGILIVTRGGLTNTDSLLYFFPYNNFF